jgi:lipid-A-disaccharide synthase
MVGVAVTSTTRSWIAKRMADQGLDWTVLEGPEALASWGSRARWALTKSGTVTLELALQGVPMMVAHRVHAWTVWWLRRRWRVERVALPNILLQQSVVPEYIQERCEAGILADALRQAWDDGEARDRQSEAFRGLRDCLVGENPGVSPDNQAACWLSAMLWGSENEKRRPSDG